MHELNDRESEARYYTCLCYVDGYDIHTAFQGMYGKVKPVPEGNNGFDYDSYFYPFRNNYEKSYAEYTDTERHIYSVRVRAGYKLSMCSQPFIAELSEFVYTKTKIKINQKKFLARGR